MSHLSLSRKVEKVLTLHMQSIFAGEGLNIYEGHEKAAAVAFPYLIVYAEDAVPHPDMPTSTGVRIVTMRFELRVDSEDETPGANPRASLDGWRKQVEDSLANVEGIMDFINAPDFGWDARGVNHIHVYDTLAQNEPSEMEHTDWIEQVVIGVVCQPCDPLS